MGIPKGAIKLGNINLSEIGKDIIVAKCNNCGNDSFHIKWDKVNAERVRIHSLLCCDCKYEIPMENMKMNPTPF